MKIINKSITLIAIVLAMSVGFTACSDSNPSDSGENAKVKGQVTDEDGNDGFGKMVSGVEGATVTMARVNANGELETVSTTSVETDADGYFTVETDVDAESNLIIMAEKDNTEWKTYLSGKVQSGSTIESAPMTTETTVEAQVYADAKAEGNANTWTSTKIKSSINAQIAAEVKGDPNAQADLYAAIRNEAQAEAAALMETSGNSQAELNAIAEAKAEAQASLEADLYAASSDDNKERAYREYKKDRDQAYRDNGSESEDQSKAMAIAGKVLVESSNSLSADAQFELKKKAYMKFTSSMESAVDARLKAMGASQATLNAAADANTELESNIMSAQSDAEIDAAFSAYHDSIVAHTEAAAEASSNVTAEMISGIDSSINATGGIKATLDAAINAAVTAGINVDAVVTAYTEFFSAIRSSVESTVTAGTNAEIDATTELLILANISG